MLKRRLVGTETSMAPMHEEITNSDPSLGGEIGEYFASIEDSFDNTLRIQAQESAREWIIPLSVSLAALSVFPVLPLIAWALTRWLFGSRKLVVYGRAVPVESFFFWYVVLVLLFVLLAWLAVSLGSKREKKLRREQETLDAPPMRFALCYAIVQEIERYSKNRIPKHIEHAMRYWRELLSSLRLFLNPIAANSTVRIEHGIEVTSVTAPDLDPETLAELHGRGFVGGPGLSRYRSVFPQIDLLRVSHPWFKLEPTTVMVINAFNSLPMKITSRLKDKKDLPSVANILRYLAAYLYSAIPEMSSKEQGKTDDITTRGERALLRFADDMERLAPYTGEPRPLAAQERASRKFVGLFLWLAALFSHDNPLVKFCVWWVLTQAIVLLVMKLAFQWIPTLKPDSTLIALAIGTPLLVSAAALAAPLRKK